MTAYQLVLGQDSDGRLSNRISILRHRTTVSPTSHAPVISSYRGHAVDVQPRSRLSEQLIDMSLVASDCAGGGPPKVHKVKKNVKQKRSNSVSDARDFHDVKVVVNDVLTYVSFHFEQCTVESIHVASINNQTEIVNGERGHYLVWSVRVKG